MCYHIFPTCDSEDKDSKPRLCREDCVALYDNVCMTELKFASVDPLYNKILPDCSVLPSRGDKDYSYCSPLHIPGKLKAVRASVQAKEVKKKFWGGGGIFAIACIPGLSANRNRFPAPYFIPFFQ